jgi:hypothetical protein
MKGSLLEASIACEVQETPVRFTRNRRGARILAAIFYDGYGMYSAWLA